MKTAIYIEDGVVQLVLTPESEFEKNAMTSFGTKPLEAEIFHGSFYDCRGGWVRQKEINRHSTTPPEDKSIILRVAQVEPPQAEAQPA